MNGSRGAYLSFITAQLLYGTLGVFRRYIPVSSAFLSCFRGLVGAAFLYLFLLLKGERFRFSRVRGKVLPLLITGGLIGLNWIVFFESFRYTTVATGTLCYDMGPIYALFLSPVFLKEKLTKKKIFCALGAIVGVLLVSGIFTSSTTGSDNLKGVFFGLLAGVLYGIVILRVRLFGDQCSALDRTFLQLLAAGVVVLPYVLLTEDVTSLSLDSRAIFFLLVLGLVHTGFAYTLYFSGAARLNASSMAILSYVDPVFAVFLSVLVLREPMDILQIIGAVLMLGFMIYSELPERRKA